MNTNIAVIYTPNFNNKRHSKKTISVSFNKMEKLRANIYVDNQKFAANYEELVINVVYAV